MNSFKWIYSLLWATFIIIIRAVFLKELRVYENIWVQICPNFENILRTPWGSDILN